jgi:cellulose synthase/poly-beta-1,6-N-acetylglucosamine synthase-like glycosyltransferase
MRSFEPSLVVERELAAPLVPVAARTGNGHVYRRALCLARIHGVPIGLVSLDLTNGDLSSADLAEIVEGSLGAEIALHLDGDGIEATLPLSPEGISSDAVPRCTRLRTEFLATAPPVSVVIPTRERPKILDRCLDHLVALDYPSYEILVVENAPTSHATRELVERRAEQFEQLRYLREDRPGQSWARNRGLAEASAPVVAFADDDVVVDRTWLSALVSGFGRADDVGCVTGMILAAELETEAQLLLEEYGGFNKGFERRIFDLEEGRAADPLFPYTAGRFGSGASMAFKADILRRVGGFSLALGTGSPPCGGEDLTAFLKVVLAGHQLVYEPAAVAYHRHPLTYRLLLRQLFRYGRGLGAYMTACVADDPTLVASFSSKALPALRYLFDGRSARNSNRSKAYPRSLVLAELAGIALGPFTYARGRAAAAALAKAAVAR